MLEVVGDTWGPFEKHALGGPHPRGPKLFRVLQEGSNLFELVLHTVQPCDFLQRDVGGAVLAGLGFGLCKLQGILEVNGLPALLPEYSKDDHRKHKRHNGGLHDDVGDELVHRPEVQLWGSQSAA